MSKFPFVYLVNCEVLALFEMFVYQVIILRQLVDRSLWKVFDSGEKVVLLPWDSMVHLFLHNLC